MASAVGVPVGVPVADPVHAETVTAQASYPVLPDLPTDQQPVAVFDQPAARLLGHKQRSELMASGFPPGLISQLETSCAVFPVRFFVCDNSGSMQAADGTRVVKNSRGMQQMVRVTRWEELAQSVELIADLTDKLGVRSDFHLLNDAGRVPQHMTLDARGGETFNGKSGLSGSIPSLGAKVTADQLKTNVGSVSPAGSTPLTEAVMRIVSQLQPLAEQMRANAQQAVVTLMTDGLPNDKTSFALALRALQALPVWLVVRLCTNDDSIVSYWDSLDRELEMSLEVLDDEAGEAGEVVSKNRWLTYGQPLHIARTFGLAHKLFDLLDEQRLVPSQAKTFCELLLGCSLPEPQLEPEEFAGALRDALSQSAAVFDPLRKCSRPWVDVDALITSMQPREESECVIL